MPTRRTRKARGREEDHRRPQTRRKYFCIFDSTKVDATKVINVSTVIPRKSMMPEWKIRKEAAEVEIRQEGRVREVLRQLDQRRRRVGNGRKVLVHLGANASSFMQSNIAITSIWKGQQEDREEERNPYHHWLLLWQRQWRGNGLYLYEGSQRKEVFWLSQDLIRYGPWGAQGILIIKDYQEGMPKRIHRDPNKPYIFRRIEDLLYDQSKSDCALG